MTPFAGSGNTADLEGQQRRVRLRQFVDAVAGLVEREQSRSEDRRARHSDTLYAELTNPATPWQQDQNYLPALSEASVAIEKRIFGIGQLSAAVHGRIHRLYECADAELSHRQHAVLAASSDKLARTW